MNIFNIFNRKTPEPPKSKRSPQAILLKKKGDEYAQFTAYEKAASFYHDAIKVDPQYVEAYIALGKVLSLSTKFRSHFEQTLGTFYQALSIEPDNYEAFSGVISTFMDMGQFDAALNEIIKYEAIYGISDSLTNTKNSIINAGALFGNYMIKFPVLDSYVSNARSSYGRLYRIPVSRSGSGKIHIFKQGTSTFNLAEETIRGTYYAPIEFTENPVPDTFGKFPCTVFGNLVITEDGIKFINAFTTPSVHYLENAREIPRPDFLYTPINNDEIRVYAGFSDSKEFTIPKKIDGYRVQEITYGVTIADKFRVTKLIIPSSAKLINKDHFRDIQIERY